MSQSTDVSCCNHLSGDSKSSNILPPATTSSDLEQKLHFMEKEHMTSAVLGIVDEALHAGTTNTASLQNLETKENVTNETEDLKIMKENILVHLSNYTGDIFFKSQQRDEPPLTSDEKKEIARLLLDSSPSNFLARFGKVLEPSHISFFHQYKDMYEVNFYLEHLQKTSASGTTNYMKNQRFHAMNELIKEGKYFSMSEMRKRNPVHFYHLVEKYMTDEERGALEQDQPKLCNLSTIFMAHIDGDATVSKRKNEQMMDQSTWDQYNALDGEDEEEEDEDDSVEADQHEQEKQFFLEEFISSNSNFCLNIPNKYETRF